MNERRQNANVPVVGGRRSTDLDPGAFVSVAAAAAAIGFSEKIVRKFIHAKALRAYRFGTDLRIRKTDLQAFIDAAVLS